MDPKEQLESLRRTLTEEEENLLFIEEQKAKFVLETEIPPTLVKEERRKQKRVEELKQRIGELERSRVSKTSDSEAIKAELRESSDNATIDDSFDKSFLDLEIRIFPHRDEGYPAEITLGRQQEFRGILAADVLPWVPSSDLAADGQRLFETLFADHTLRSAWSEARGQSSQRRIRLRIDPDAAELHILPWELLQEGPVMLSAQADTPFSRCLPVAKLWGGPVEARPIRVLVVISDPADIEDKYGLPRADAELERSTLESAFEAVDPGDLQVDFLDPPVTLVRLEEKLREGYHILHYQGHGAFSAKQERAVLYMQDEQGLTRLVYDDELSSMLKQRGVQPRLVFLAACESAARSPRDAFLGMAPKLVSVGVPAVVAMRELLTVESALRFSQTFYQQLLEHGLVDLATNEARSTLLTAGRPDAAVPVLFMRLKYSELWKRIYELERHIEKLIKKHRRIDAAAPSHAEVGRDIFLLVQVRFPDSPLLGIKDWPPTKRKPSSIERASEPVALVFPVDTQTGKLGPTRLEVQIVAPDFSIGGAARKLVEVPPDQWSTCIRFPLTPKRAGVCRISVEMYSVDHLYLGTIPVEVETTGDLVVAPPTVVVGNLILYVAVSPSSTDESEGTPTEHTTQIGSVTGPVHTGSGDIIVVSEIKEESSTTIKAEVHGSGAIAQGGGAVAAGAGVIAVSGDVGGSVTQTTIIYRGVEVTIPSAEVVARHRAALRERLEADARARWGGMSVYIQEEGATLPVEASPYQTGRLGPRENLLQTLHTADRLLVLGEPGSGKTVSLERLAWETCGGVEPVVPVVVRLFRYDGTPLADWVRALLQGTGHLRLDSQRALAAFLKEETGRCIFLFDGLNEVSPPYRDRLVGELVRWMSSYPRHPVVLTSRPQDELWRRLRGEAGRTVVVQPIGDGQAQAYLVAHLGKGGADLHGRLDERLRELVWTPLMLWMVKEAGAHEESVPGNRGELYARFVSRMLQRDTDRRMDAEIPERVKRQALAGLAYHLGREQRLSCPCDEAVAVVAQILGEGQAGDVIGACARHGLLAGDDPIWFAPHQTVQEHFAALALREMAEQEWEMGRWAQLKRAGRQLLTGQEEGLAQLAADDWWTETFVQLAGLVDDGDRLAREVLRVNPWLAWWCVEEGRGVAEETRDAVADRSMGLLDSERVVDRRRAVATLARIRSERAVQPLFRAAGDPDEEVAGLAVQTLAEMGEAARTSVEGALRGTDRRLWRAALRYLGARPDETLWSQIPEGVWEEVLGLPMVWVPPGPFLMGSDKEKDAQAADDELPQHEVILPGYWIGRYPVTVAQFRAFAEQSGYGQAHEDSLRGSDDHPVVDVTWHDALAFCRWLSGRTRLPVTLPSEAEWEKAARGMDGRIYPWGNKWDAERCNASEGGKRGTTPVGVYSPQGDSPYGCADMAGNVREWTRSLRLQYQVDFGYPYDPSDGRENLEARHGTLRVLRGGSFYCEAGSVRCASRLRSPPLIRFRNHGFRVIVASPVQL